MSTLEDHEERDRLKLEALRCIANDAFEAKDRGEYVTVSLEQLDEFMDQGYAPGAHGQGGMTPALRAFICPTDLISRIEPVRRMVDYTFNQKEAIDDSLG